MAKSATKKRPAARAKRATTPLNRPSFGIKLAREQCYVCWMSAPENPPKLRKSATRMRKEHHDYLVSLERKGILFGAGPFVNEKGERVGVGMLIIRAPSTAAARRIANAEPYTKAGQRVMTVTPWQRNEGCINLSINFADGELSLDNRTWTLTPKG
ncbi:MAG TPA: YciI family protein [Alphaproteobacteria bacterium]|nr:YciI family protein [Alphaproteobacteria bacterium]